VSKASRRISPWQRGEPVDQLERGEGEFGLAGWQGLGQGVAGGLVVTLPGEPLAGEGGAVHAAN